MKIDVLVTDKSAQASPVNVKLSDIYTRGVGGAELSLLTWAEVMTKKGCTVTIYNILGHDDFQEDGVDFKRVSTFNPDDNRDVLILWRSPHDGVRNAKGLKVFWSTDQQTMGDYESQIFPFVDKVVCISPFHAVYHQTRYAYGNDDFLNKITYLDLGVRDDCFAIDKGVASDKTCIFCSVPDRGLNILTNTWPRILRKHPDAQLIVTSDHSLWGARFKSNPYANAMDGVDNVQFVGKVPREELIELQAKSQFCFSSITYPELFCISSAECQVQGGIPITGALGSLPTTNKMGYPIAGNPNTSLWQNQFVKTVITKMNKFDHSSTVREQENIKQKARERFSWDNICNQWITDIFGKRI